MEFKRENRYLVFKPSDIKEALSTSEIDDIQYLYRVTNATREQLGKKPLECVVVEKDWPEYESTWRAIEARVAGAQAQPAPSVPDDVIERGIAELENIRNRLNDTTLMNDKTLIERLYAAMVAAPETKPAPSAPNNWLRAIDEALVVTHLGVANAGDSYEDAKHKLNELICWHVTVATDPAVNGGFKLVPADEQPVPRVSTSVITDYLVSISAHVAQQDDSKAQAEIGELLRMLATESSVPEAKS